MKTWDSGKEQDKLLNKLERQQRQQAFKQDRFLKFKLPEIHNKLSQTLLMKRIIETDNPTAISGLILNGLKKAMRSQEFDFKYFIAPIRDLVPRPNPHSLYMTQYIMEVMIDDPNVIDIYGTDEEIYEAVNEVFSKIRTQFERAEEEIVAQLARDKSVVPGSRDYEIALEQLIRKKLGDPQK
ncbi:MAG: DUF507 family protein [Desulfobacteraceae bacterium]|nr:DUF507 family protein [Desulfobacteraceae bacterium]